MSRWIKLFDNHAFKTTWEDLKEKLKLVEIDKTIASNVEELARLKKVVAFIDNAIDGIDFELIPKFETTVLNNWNTKATDCRNQINSFNSNNNITYLKNANKSIDELLNYLKSYIFMSDKLKKSLLSSIRAYTNEVDKHLEQITDTQTEYEKVKEFRNEIEKYYDLLFEDSDEEESIKLQISTLLEKAEEQYREINKFYNETLIDEEQESTKTTVEEAKKDILRDAEEANKKLVDVSAKIEELGKFYINIFGSENDDGSRSGGLKKEIEQRISDLEAFKIEQEKVYAEEMKSRLDSLEQYDKEQKEQHQKLYDKIESHLPGAISAGLAKSYQDMKNSFEDPIKKWNWVFIGSVSIMFIATFLSFVHIGIVENDVYTLFSFAKMGNFTDTLNSLLFKLPLYAPLIWLAIFASKRRSENQRLQQEYAHKEAVAKSYVSYKMQIDELKQEDKHLLEKLLNSSIDTISHNASESLDKNHGDQTPAQDIIKSFVEQVSKLKG